MIRQVKFVSIPCTDQKRTLEFFTEKVGFEVYTDQPFADDQRWIELKIRGADTRIVLFTPEPHRDWIGGFSNITFACDDVRRTYEQMTERGVAFVQEPTKQPWGTYALFKDPDGTTFCLSSSS